MNNLSKEFDKKFGKVYSEDTPSAFTPRTEDILSFIRQREKELLGEIEGYFVEEMGATPPNINTIYDKFSKIRKELSNE